MEISSCLLYVAPDLLAQSLDRRKFDFIAQPIEKANLHLALRRQFDGMKVQQVSLDGKRIRSEGWAVSYIGYRIKAFCTHACPRDVDAILWNKFFIARQIDGRHRVLGAVAAAAAGRAQNTERTGQQMPRPAYSPLIQ